MTMDASSAPRTRKKQTVILIVCLVLVMAAAAGWFLLRPALQSREAYAIGCELLEAGDWAAAREIFDGSDYPDREEKLNECSYLEAKELLEKGDNSGAKELFLSLAAYRDSAAMVSRCDYAAARELMDGGEYIQAAEVFSALGELEDSAAMLDECREAVYAGAKQRMIHCEFSAAEEDFRWLGDYKDSEKQLSNCEERIAAEKDFAENPHTVRYNLTETFKNGKLYYVGLGYAFVPDETNADTTWLVYYPGGNGTGQNLSVPCIYLEHNKFRPNAVMLYLFNNGWNDTRSFNLEVAELMKQLALECGIWFHDVVTVGSSNGCYPAMVASAVFYEGAGITVDAVIDFDPGCEWDIEPFALLTPEESDTVALSGTKIYLMEQRNFSSYAMTVEPVTDMLEHGVDIVLIECDNDGHNHIGPDAIRAGFYDFAMGQLEGLEPISVSNRPYVIRMIQLYPDGSQESLEVPYLDPGDGKYRLVH